MTSEEIARTRRRAMDLLARREHTQKELYQKLTTRGFEADIVDEVLISLTEAGLISETRFTEAYISARRRRGIGPRRLIVELRQRGVATAVIEDAVGNPDLDWGETARQVRHKKFGDSPPADLADRARQTRFLEYRGFDTDLIRVALDG